GLSEEADLGSARGFENLVGRAGYVVQDQVLKRQPRVRGAGDPEIEQVDVEALLHQVLHQAVTRYQVQDVRLEYEPVDQEYRDRSSLAATAFCAPVAVETGLVLGPDHLSRRSSCLDPDLLQQYMCTRGVLPHADRLRAVVVDDPERSETEAIHMTISLVVKLCLAASGAIADHARPPPRSASPALATARGRWTCALAVSSCCSATLVFLSTRNPLIAHWQEFWVIKPDGTTPQPRPLSPREVVSTWTALQSSVS